ncbi:type II secretion system protein [Anaerobacillus alkaliphilus]|uniref:Type II secretion system protein n=1 Tax=Anaerobacillus alkaliphilus TaxID=1548597 RepID=A0A4Q0VRF9_9BACI|nr:competence type IV pilus minor pilin ComGD [Anaerobacillus alkaliphilus]RXI99482.1 type II secretion system protein [Anaerobacillus alkaliphilus]
MLIKNEKGHTLLEMSLVLFIIAVVSSISIINMKSTYDAGIRNQFLYQLQQDLYYAQQMAISKQTLTTVIFYNGTKEYRVIQNGRAIIQRDFPHIDTRFFQGTLALNDIHFLSNGSPRKSGSLTFSLGDYRYRLVLLMGRGRFYIEQF